MSQITNGSHFNQTVPPQTNAGFKPKEGEVTSVPWQWPINYRVRNQF